MRIVIDIGHPAQVHFFRHAIQLLKKHGHQVRVTTVDKDVACALLDAYQISYTCLGQTGQTFWQKLCSIPRLNKALYQVLKEWAPDIFVGFGSIRAAQVAWWLRKRSVIFNDTEATWREHILYAPFAHVIATPYCFRRSLGRKHQRFHGYAELAYLHPSQFQADISVLKDLGVEEGQRYFVLRFVAWQATHDLGHQGFCLAQKRNLISYLNHLGKVFISAEGSLETEFQPYVLPTAVQQMHDVLAQATLFISESHTMSTEAALLGTPAVRFNTYVGEQDMGNFVELEKRYDLIHSFNDYEQMMTQVGHLLTEHDLKKQWARKRDHLLLEQIDVTSWMVHLIENQNVKKA